jgi:hypothetical protein
MEETEEERSRKYLAARTQATLDQWNSPKAQEKWNEYVQALVGERDARIAREWEREQALLARLTQEQREERKQEEEREQEPEQALARERAELREKAREQIRLERKANWLNLPEWLRLVIFFGTILILGVLLSK